MAAKSSVQFVRDVEPARQQNFKILPLGSRDLMDSERYRELDRRQRYYDCTQHDHKTFDFDGRVIAPGSSGSQPYRGYSVGSEKFAAYVPLKMRRPSSPYRLGRVIVNSFTNLVFGENSFPVLRTEGDPKSQDFNQALVKACRLPMKMIRARNIGGSVGTVALSWSFINGKPRVSVHNPKNLFVHEWDDRTELIPAHVSEVYKFIKDEPDPIRQNKIVRNYYWYRRDWTLDEEVTFLPVLAKPNVDPVWTVDQNVKHGDGTSHVVWIQNIPTDEIDGIPDYDGLYENFEDLDLVLSIITRGAILNLDPTLKLKMDPDYVSRMGVRKGSDNAIATGEDGDADYLELAGTSITAGIELFNAKRRAVLEVANCVIPDPSEVAASGISSVAQKLLFSPMLAKGDIFREQYGTGVETLIDNMSSVARENWGSRVVVPALNPGADDPDSPEAKETDGTWSLSLPPLVTKEQPKGEDGSIDPEEDPIITKEDRHPGEGGEVEANWPPWFPPTPEDRNKEATTLSLACGTKAFLSVETATEVMAGMYGMEADEEKRRVAAAQKIDDDKQASMFADTNGAMGGAPGAPGKFGKPAIGKPGKVPTFGKPANDDDEDLDTPDNDTAPKPPKE